MKIQKWDEINGTGSSEERMEAFHDLYVEILEGLIRKEDV
jgi:hypothetical protein